MQRNRKRESLRLGVVAKSMVACVYVAAVGLGYVWQKNQILRLYDDIKKRETALSTVQKRNTQLAAQLAHWRSPAQLEARAQQYNLGLVAPREGQVVRVVEPATDAAPMTFARETPVAPPRAAPARLVAKR